MGLARPLRLGHWLADNVDPLIDRAADRLREAGIETIVERNADGESDVFFGCGLLTRRLVADGADLEIVAAPIFPGETEATYRTVFIARKGDPLDLLSATREHHMAVNEESSWSGWNAYLAELEHLGVDAPPETRRHTTGSHLASIRSVRTGGSDFAAIDSSVWAHHNEEHDGLTVFATGRDWPAPPISVASTVDAETRELLCTLPNTRAATTDVYDEMYATALRLS